MHFKAKAKKIVAHWKYDPFPYNTMLNFIQQCSIDITTVVPHLTNLIRSVSEFLKSETWYFLWQIIQACNVRNQFYVFFNQILKFPLEGNGIDRHLNHKKTWILLELSVLNSKTHIVAHNHGPLIKRGNRKTKIMI
jgi:hypothetical protein